MNNMNTKFTVTTDANTPYAKAYTIDLGCDVLDNESEDSIRTMATESKKIKIQSPLRKKKSAEEMETYLRKTYPDAIVTNGVIKPKSVDSEINALIKIMGKDKAIARLTEIANEHKSE
jgi:hypothetical protein